MNILVLTIVSLLFVIVISLFISLIYDDNKTENNKTEKKLKKDIKELNVAIKTTDIHGEGLDIIDFLHKIYNVGSEKYKNIDEYKDSVKKHISYIGCYWIVCGVILGKKGILIVSACYFSEKSFRNDDYILFDNFSDFKKYIEDVKNVK